MARGSGRNMDKESAWRRSIVAQAESGQSVRSWCRIHGVNENSFFWWRRELARRDTALSAADPSQQSLPTRPAKLSQPRSQQMPQSQSAPSSSPPQAASPQRLQPASFVPVHVTDDGSVDALPNAFDRETESRIEILLTDGRCVRIVGAVDRQAVVDVLEVLEPRGC